PIKCEGHRNFVVAVAGSPGGKLVASGADDQTLRVWGAAGGKALRTISAAHPPGPGGLGGAGALSPHGPRGAAHNPQRGLQFYDPATGRRARGHAPLKDGAYGVAFSPDGKQLAVANHDGVRVYSATRGNKLHEFTFDRKQIGRAWRVAFTPDGKHLAA